MLEDLETRSLEYNSVREFLADLKKIEKFVQKFRRVARGSRYNERLLVKEFKQGMNGKI